MSFEFNAQDPPAKVRRGIPAFRDASAPINFTFEEEKLGEKTIALFAHALHVHEQELEEVRDGEVIVESRNLWSFKIPQRYLVEIEEQKKLLKKLDDLWDEKEKTDDEDDDDDDDDEDEDVDESVKIVSNTKLNANLAIFIVLAFIAWYIQNKLSRLF